MGNSQDNPDKPIITRQDRKFYSCPTHPENKITKICFA
jgi:hypothetical protein